MKKERNKLLRAGFIKKVRYFVWLANVVITKITNGKWRICVDLTILNKFYSKNNFPLQKIDQLVDTTAEHGLLSFMET